MVENMTQLRVGNLDKGGTGVESALYIFVPSLMSDPVGFGTPAQPLDTDPRPPLIVRNMPETLPIRQLRLFSARDGHMRKHERTLQIMTYEVPLAADGQKPVCQDLGRLRDCQWA